LHLAGLTSRRISDTQGIHQNTINRYLCLFNTNKAIYWAIHPFAQYTQYKSIMRRFCTWRLRGIWD